jgi:hypothetical protein
MVLRAEPTSRHSFPESGSVNDDQDIERDKGAFDTARIGDEDCCKDQIDADLKIELQEFRSSTPPQDQEKKRQCQRKDIEEGQEGDRSNLFRQKTQPAARFRPIRSTTARTTISSSR